MFLKAKSEAFNAFKRYKAYAENLLNAKILCMRIDKGREYMSNEFIDFMLDHGITRQYTARARPQQNGVVERANRTIQEHVVAMLEESGLPPSFLGQAAAAYVHVVNCCVTSSLPSETPYEAWTRKKPDVSHLRVWGCTSSICSHSKRQAQGNWITYGEVYICWLS